MNFGFSLVIEANSKEDSSDISCQNSGMSALVLTLK